MHRFLAAVPFATTPRRALLPTVALLSTVALLGCAASPPSSDASGEQALAGSPAEVLATALSAATIVDLSHTYGDDTLYWPTDTEGFRHQELAYGETEGGYFYSSYSFSTAEHGGTHIDAPIHFAEGAWTLDEVPPERFVRPAVVIDMAEKAAADPDALLDAADVEAWEAEHGRVPEGVAVLLRTGWDARWPDALQYLGDDAPGDASDLHFPSYGADAARLLVEDRGVALLGVDTASIDYGPSTGFEVHRVAAAANVAGLENLRGLDALPPTGAWVLALPMKIEDGSGGPVRVLALVP